MVGANSLFGFLYELVRSSWMVASVVMKYFLLAVILRSVELGDYSFEGFEERMLKYGKYTVLGTGILGVIFQITGLSVEPLFLFPSQLIAVIVLGFLFWKY